MEKTYRIYIILNIIFPLIIGVLIYLLLRDENLIIYNWLDSIGIPQVYLPFDFKISSSSAAFLPSWVKYSLSDGIWMYVFTSSIFIIWVQRIDILWIVIPLILGIGFEVAQFLGYVPGTFDYMDLIFLVLFYLFAVITGFTWRRKCIKT